MQVVLFQPQIPQNTGNIVRTCALTQTGLVLVRPLGFSTSSRWLKRSGLDYWEEIDITFIDDLDTFLSTTTCPFYFFSSRAKKLYTQPSYEPNALLIFGSETAGLPPSFHEKWPERFFTLPMGGHKSRCLNLSNTVSIVIYRAWEQQGFPGSSFSEIPTL